MTAGDVDQERGAMVAAITGWPEQQAEYLWNVLSDLDVPEGFRVELIEEEIVVSPPPLGDHEHDVAQVVRQVIRSAARDFDVSGTKGLRTPRGLYIPDVTVVDDGRFRGQRRGCRPQARFWWRRCRRPAQTPTAR